MRRVGLRFATAAALIALASWAAGGNSGRAAAQEGVRRSGLKPDSTTTAQSVTRLPLVVASGPQYANVRGLATDSAGGLFISLSETPAPQDCVSSAISVPTRISKSGAQETEDAAASDAEKIPLTFFSNCTLARAEEPSGIVVTPHAKVYLANRAQNSIRLLDMLTGKVFALPESPAAAKSATHISSSNLDPYDPAGLAIDAEGNLYIADRGNNRVLALRPGVRTFSYVAHVLDADAIAVNPSAQTEDSKLYVASPASNRVFVIDLRSNALDVFAGSGAAPNSGATNAQIDSNPANAAIGAPEGVAVDGAGNVFIADTGANALLRVDAASGKLSRIVLGANVSSPGALAIDRAGNVFVADRGNARILEFPRLASPQTSGTVSISPASFDFGAEPRGGTTPVQQFTLTNNSANALALTNQDFAFTGANSADFTQTNNCVPSVPAGSSCVINVTFTPSGTGARAATLQVTDVSGTQSASLSGTGDDFQLTAASQVATVQNVAPGGTAKYSLSVTPDNTFSGAVMLGCPSVLSAQTQTITCTITPTSVTVTAGQPQSFSVAFTTGGPNATRVLPFARPTGPGARMRLLLLALLAMALAMCLLFARRAAMERFAANSAGRARLAAIVFATLAVAAAAGCKYHAPPFNPNETPPGTYTIDINGSAQNASRSITLTLNVE